MKSCLRLLPFLSTVLLLVFVVAGAGLEPRTLFDARVLGFTVVVPWLVLALADEPRAAFVALGAGLASGNEGESDERHARAAGRLRELAGITHATGVIAALSLVLGGMNALADSGGQGHVGQVADNWSGALLGPVYAVLIAELLYRPLAARLDG